MKVAVVGATGLVGSKMLKVLEERNFPVTECREWTVVSADEAIAKKPAVAIFSAGGAASGELAPKFAAVGCRVVDNSSYWRMDPTKKLVIPEINGDVLGPDDYIIANPNCSTIQMLMPLAPLQKAESAPGRARRRNRQLLSPSDRPQHPPPHRQFPRDGLHQGRDEDGQ